MVDVATIISILVQVAIGVVLTFIVYGISLLIMNSDGLQTDAALAQGIRSKTTILDGVIDANSVVKRVYNTVLPNGQMPYLPIRRSVNRLGGAQFTYSFWMKVDNISYVHDNKSICNLTKDSNGQVVGTDYSIIDNPDLFVLFIKGDNRCFQYTTTAYDSAGTTALGNPINHQGRYVMSPMVAIGDPMNREIFVFFNTLDEVGKNIKLAKNPNLDSTLRHNVVSLTEKMWIMYTFVFMDYVPINDFENGIVIKSYVNDTLYQMDKIPGTLRDNEGEFTLLPDGAPGANTDASSSLHLSSMDYYNYALSDKDVTARFSNGVNMNANSDITADKSGKLNFSAYNKLDVYNL